MGSDREDSRAPSDVVDVGSHIAMAMVPVPVDEFGHQQFAVAGVRVVRHHSMVSSPSPAELDEWHMDPTSLLTEGTPIYTAMSVLELPFKVDAARIARGHIRRWLTGNEPEVINAAALVVTELVSNAYRHASPPISLHYRTTDTGSILIAVSDASPELPAFTTLTDELTATLGPQGRGIGMTHRFAERIGWIRRPEGGKYVWALIGTPARTSAAEPILETI